MQPAAPVEAARSAWQRPHAIAALDGERDTDLWLWLLSAAISVGVGLRFFGHYYMQLVPPLALLAAGALARGGAPCRHAPRSSSRVVRRRACSRPPGYFMHPFGAEPDYESVSRYLAATTHPDDPILVWGSVPEIYWASGRRPATRFLTTPRSSPATTPGRPPDDADTGADTADAGTYFYEDFTAHPPRVLPRHVTGEGARRASTTRSREFPRLERDRRRRSTATCAPSTASTIYERK